MSILSSIWRKQEHAASGVAPRPGDAPIAKWAQSAADFGEARPHEEHRFIARQAIFDRQKEVYGYELLCRSGWENHFTGDSDEATRIMIADGALHGFQELTRGTRSFVNCTRESLVDGLVTVLPNSTILEILETVAPDEEVLAACRALKKLGYEIALDDFRLGEGMEALVTLADYVKVDFRLSGKEERRTILASLAGNPVQLIAEKIETEEELHEAMQEGFELFQGYFFCHPTVFASRRTPTNGSNYLRLLAALSHESFDVDQITNLVKSEVTICYQLLRLVNSAGFGVVHEVRSVHDAVVLVGEDQFRKLVLNAIATESCRRHPDELLLHVLHRARFLELMAPFTGERASEQYLFGLLSLMDVMLDVPAANLADVLPLRPQIKAALLGASNEITVAVRLLESYETGNWVLCAEQARALQLSERELAQIYERSLQWAIHSVHTEQAHDLRIV